MCDQPKVPVDQHLSGFRSPLCSVLNSPLFLRAQWFRKCLQRKHGFITFIFYAIGRTAGAFTSFPYFLRLRPAHISSLPSVWAMSFLFQLSACKGIKVIVSVPHTAQNQLLFLPMNSSCQKFFQSLTPGLLFRIHISLNSA